MHYLTRRYLLLTVTSVVLGLGLSLCYVFTL